MKIVLDSHEELAYSRYYSPLRCRMLRCQCILAQTRTPRTLHQHAASFWITSVGIESGEVPCGTITEQRRLEASTLGERWTIMPPRACACGVTWHGTAPPLPHFRPDGAG